MNRLLPLALLCASATSICAQRYEISPVGGMIRFSRAPLGSLSETSPKNDDTHLQGAPAYGLRLTKNSRGYWGFELGYLQSKPRLYTRVPQETGDPIPATSKITVHHASLDILMYMMPSGERFRPYLTGGAMAVQYGQPNIAGWTRSKSRNYGANYGAGLKIKLVEHFLFRLDFRDYIGGKPYDLTWENQGLSGGMLHQLEGTVGLSIAF